MKYGLEESTIAKIQNVLARHKQVQQAILYGSRARGNYRTGSDIDLTLLGDKELNLSVLYRIMDEIDDLLLPYTFDISLLHTITDQDVLDHIQRIGTVFYEKRPQSHVT
jgi:predicted nucleotidyltransferase